MTTPLDVSVIVPVFNATPYLTECLTSLVGQTLAPDRMEIIAVDDGSTDGSAKELDRFAQLHPGRFTILRQRNSGGPASPCNRGLDVATGRYVYFVGADDYLWREALEHLVAEADEYGSDVVAGKMVGVNGRRVKQALYARTDHDAQLYTSALPWSMSNAKLFRRELIEKHGLRFPEDLPVNSDQAFTLEACIHARRISVLADDTYYFAVLRTDAGNITYRTKPEVNLRCASEIMHRAATLIEAGPRRDAILRRHFAWELMKVLTVKFLDLDEAKQKELCLGVAGLVGDYFTDNIRDGLTVRRRLLLCLAQAGKLDVLREVVREQAQPTAPPLFLDGDRAFVRYAGLRDEHSVEDRCYEILGENVIRRLTNGLEVLSLGWQRRPGSHHLVAALRVPVIGPAVAESAHLRVWALPSGIPAERLADRRSRATSVADSGSRPSIEVTGDGLATIVRARVAIGPLLAHGAGKWTVALFLEVAGRPYQLPLLANTLLPQTPCWFRGQAFGLSSKATKNGRLQLVVEPVPRRTAVGEQMRRILASGRRK